MFLAEEKLPDPLRGDIGKLIGELQARTTWGQREQDLRAQLVDRLAKQGYVSLVGHPSRYHLTLVAESCLYDVPPNRRGILKVFRGKRIRIVCVNSGRFDRGLMAGVID
jgi:hypothetical protein